MTISEREKILAVVVVVLLVPAAGWVIFQSLGGLMSDLRARETNLSDELEKKSGQIEALEPAEQQWNAWKAASLPAKANEARQQYKAWLYELVAPPKFQQANVDASLKGTVPGVYQKLEFKIGGQATLEQLTQFLYAFDSAGHLHLIRHIEMKPVGKSGDLRLDITIEALALDQADRADKLSELPGKRLAQAGLADYKLIADRNLFAPYTPPKPKLVERPAPPEPKAEPFDPSKYAQFTGIVAVEGQAPEAWLKSRTTDEKFYLRPGDPFEIGPLKGTVIRIGAREVEIEVAGVRHVVPLGESVRKAEGETGTPASPPAGAKPDAKPEVNSDAKPEPKPEASPDQGQEGKRRRKPSSTREGKSVEKVEFRPVPERPEKK